MAITFHSDVWFTCIIYRDHWNWPRKLTANSNGHNFLLECMIDAHDISRHSNLNNGSSQEIQMAITFHSDVRFTCIICRDPQNWPRKLSANSNGHNFLLEWMIDAHYISRRSKLRPSRNSNLYNFSFGCPIHVHQISRPSKLNTEALGEFKRS